MSTNTGHEDIDFDKLFDEELPFKPLTQGLGFHHKPKEEKTLGTLKARSKDLERSLNERASTLQKNRQAAPVPEKDMGDLAPFYSSTQKQEVEPQISVEETVVAGPETAGILLRFVAFTMDAAIILSALAVTFLSILISSGISLMVIRENLSLQFAASYIMPISVLFYFFYFSFFDKTLFSSPGKKLMGLRVVSETSENMKMSQSFMRSVVTLAAIATLGMIGLLDLQGKMTETKVVQK